MNDLEKTLKEPNFIIRSSSAMTMIQQKAWVFMYLHAKNSLDDIYHYLPLADISNILQVHYDQDLKDSLEAMNGSTVQWNTFGIDGEVESWTTSSMVGSARIVGNTVKYEFTQAMKEVFRENPGFAQLDLPSLIALRGKHALKLWRICKIYKDTLTGSTGWQTVEQWRKVFGLKNSEYPTFFEFNRTVIKKAIAEINKVSDMRIKAEYRKNGRIVTEIRFLRMSDTKETPKQINEAPKEAENIPPQFAWYNKQTKVIQKKLQTEFESICKVDDQHQRQIEWGQYLAIKMKKDAQQLPLFLK